MIMLGPLGGDLLGGTVILIKESVSIVAFQAVLRFCSARQLLQDKRNPSSFFCSLSFTFFLVSVNPMQAPPLNSAAAACMVLGYVPAIPAYRGEALTRLQAMGLVAVHVRGTNRFFPVAVSIDVQAIYPDIYIT